MVERRAGRDEPRDVGDVHPHPDPVALAADRDRVVEVLRGLGVDREREQVAEVDAALEARLGRLVGLEVRRGAPCSTSSPSSTVSIELRRAEHALEPRAPAARADDDEVAGAGVAEPVAVERERHARA